MADSCDECIKGSIHAGLPQGTEEQIHGLTTYITGNRTNPRGIIVMYSDIFGLALPNNKLIADAYAKGGEWLVYLPDFFPGNPQSTFAKYTGLLAGVPAFLLWQRRHREEATEEVCVGFLQRLRRDTPREMKIGIVGFCWGGKYVVRAGLERNVIEIQIDGDGGNAKVPLVDAVVALHPSHLAIPADVETLVVPTAFGWGVEDSFVDFKLKAAVEDVHAGAKQAGRQVPEIEHKEYRPGRHGFAVRGNPDDPLERTCLKDSVTQVLDWFGRWL
ncbi:Alpha/Beta hydrolase protein [Aspergillus crustosus]